MLSFDFIQACEIIKGFVTEGSIFSHTITIFPLFVSTGVYPQVLRQNQNHTLLEAGITVNTPSIASLNSLLQLPQQYCASYKIKLN